MYFLSVLAKNVGDVLFMISRYQFPNLFGPDLFLYYVNACLVDLELGGACGVKEQRRRYTYLKYQIAKEQD